MKAGIFVLPFLQGRVKTTVSLIPASLLISKIFYRKVGKQMKQQQTPQTTVCRIAAFLLVFMLLFGSLALVVGADGERVTITRLEWQNTETLVYGNAKTVAVVGYDEEGTAYQNIYTVKYPAGYGNVNEEGYVLTAVLTDTSFTEADGLEHTKNVTIAPKEYGVEMNDKTVSGDGQTPYMIPVTGVDANGEEMPYGVRTQIAYTYVKDGQAVATPRDYGTYAVTATLPVGNYLFYSGGTPVDRLEATLVINREMEILNVNNLEGESDYIVFLSADLDENGNKVGLSGTLTATATAVDAADVKLPKGAKYAQIFRLQLVGAGEDETFSLIVPLTEIVYHNGCGKIDAKSVYVYSEESDNPVLASTQGYTVSKGSGYVKISNIPATNGSLFVMVAPQFSSGLPIGWIIAIIVIIFIILLVIFFFVGRAVAKKKAEEKAEEQPAEEPAEEEPAVETMAPVEEEPAPAEEEDTGADPTQPAMRGLVYIDVVKKPEEYGLMLMKEKAGEGTIVYRYRKSYLAKLALADGKIGEYYSIVKNALLHFRGVKARKSWNYEAFNQGRNQIAKVIPNGKTLYLYLAIDPKTLEGTKYGAIDVSEKKKFEVTPSLMKVRGDRKLKFALELIEKICGEMLELKPLEKPDEDYKPANQTAEKLFDAGLIRKMAALAPLPTEEEQGE